MKFIKWRSSSESEAVSIAWSQRHSAYVVTNSQDIGDVVLKDYDEVCKLKESGFSTEVLAQAKLAGLDPSKIDFNVYRLSPDYIEAGHMYETRVSYNESKNELPFGVFVMRISNHGELLFKPYKNNEEKLTLVKNKNLKEMVLEFFQNKVVTGRKDKMGVLLYGPPGNGKTTEIMDLFSICEENKLRIFIIDSNFRLQGFEEVRHLLSKDNCIFVLEEVTERLGRGVEEILTFLDGENSWSNSITIATTNYPEDLPANLVDRPGRFEQFIEYGNPTKADIIKLGEAFGFSEEQVTCLAGQNLSFDYVSFILSSAKKLNKSVKETREFEEDKRKRLSQTFKGKMGI